ncbi:MAG: IS110 family transposase [Candidatus Acidiferrales bacterium]
MIYIGVDLHQRFCYMTMMDASGAIGDQRQVPNDAESLRKYFQQWPEAVEAAVEACSFWQAFVDRVSPLVARLVLVHPKRVKAIASAKLKNDRVDSETLAHLLRANLLPESWMADRGTRELRQQTRLRVSLGQTRAQLKNRVHAVLHQQGLRPPVSDLFGRKGRAWLNEQPLPEAARRSVDTYLELIGQLDQKISFEEQQLNARAKSDPAVRDLMTIPGIGAYSAAVLLAEIGDVHRFSDKRQLYSYAGLVPRVRQSGEHTRSGHITREGSRNLRWILVEAAQVAPRCSPGARHYFDRLARRKPRKVARVALARKLLGAVYALLRHGVCFDEQVFAAM